jgi:ABC-2 type transport system ATP-binding protein
VLEVRGVAKAYGDVAALDGIDLEVGAGEICALLGPNGAGKTTLVSIVAGLLRADAGAVRVGGLEVAPGAAGARALVGLAPQELGIYPSVSVLDNLTFFAELNGLRGPDRARRVDEVAEALELVELLDRRAMALSGGEKRRLHTAAALLHRPPLLLLDEPTTGVDVSTRARLLATVRELAERDGTAICYSTHYLPEVESLGASVAIIERGRIIARGDLAALVREHGNAAVELVFDGPPPTLDRADADVDGETLRVRSDRPAEEAAVLLGALGPDAARLRSVEIVAPSLEAVFLSLTGRRFRADVEEGVDAV